MGSSGTDSSLPPHRASASSAAAAAAGAVFPRFGLEQDRRRYHLDGPKLLGHHEAMVVVADHDGGLSTIQDFEPLDGRLQQRAPLHEGDELLGEKLAREGPESVPGATGENDGKYRAAHPVRDGFRWESRPPPGCGPG